MDLGVDYRGVNAVTRLTSWPLPTLDSLIDRIGGCERKPCLYAALDLKCGFYQSSLDPATAEKAAFQTDSGTWTFRRTVMGLTGAPVFFQRLMDEVFRGMPVSSVLTYIDDILVLGCDPEDLFDKL